MDEDKYLTDWETGGPLAGFAQPIDRLERLRRLEVALKYHVRVEVALARREGSSWAEVGAALGMSRQAAHEQFR